MYYLLFVSSPVHAKRIDGLNAYTDASTELPCFVANGIIFYFMQQLN